jgi:UDP-N-acetylmuramoylalanine--D-glutamate ligase
VLLPLDEIALPGAHNRANVAAALCLLEGLGLDASDPRVLAAVRTLEGLPHRMERIVEVGGVVFYNDSKATNPDSMRAALGALGRSVVLIAGGRAKGGDYGELSELLKVHVAGVVVLGEAAPLLAEAWGDTGIPMEHAGSDLEEAVRLAYELARAGGHPVLFSPGCASFDMFRDFEDRGDQFREIVTSLEEGV